MGLSISDYADDDDAGYVWDDRYNVFIHIVFFK
jgi:hypothetical protein